MPYGKCGTCGGSGRNLVQCQRCDGRSNCNTCNNTRMIWITRTACKGSGKE